MFVLDIVNINYSKRFFVGTLSVCYRGGKYEKKGKFVINDNYCMFFYLQLQ